MNDISRRVKEKEFKKQLIAEAAYQLFSNSSFDAVTVQDIATAAEFGKGTIYQYFDSKEDILVFVICQAMDTLHDNIQSQCLHHPDVKAALYRLMDLNYHFYLDHSNLFLSLLRRRLEGCMKPEWTSAMKPRREAKIKLMAQLIDMGIDENVLMPFNSHELARFLENIIKGFSLEVLETRSAAFDPQKDLELITKALSNGILYHEGEE